MTSFCSQCHKPIAFVKLDGKYKVFNMKQRGGELVSDNVPHYRSCSGAIKAREQSNCPACNLNRLGKIELIDTIDVDKDLCRIHEASQKVIVGTQEIDLGDNNLHKLRKKMVRTKLAIAKKRQEMIDEGILNALDSYVK